MYEAGQPEPALCGTWRARAEREVGGELRREGTHVYLWLIHIRVRQRPSQYGNYPPIKINKKSRA